MASRKASVSLAGEHDPAAIRARLSHPAPESIAGDIMLGAVDGLVTTFAVVAGSAGGGLSTKALLILGVSNLIADGFSMAASNYLGTRTRQQAVARARSDELAQIEACPGGERREIHEIYARKGIDPETLERVVQQITADRDVWVDTMMAEELRMSDAVVRPLAAGLATFFSFLAFGILPLLPYLLGLSGDRLLVSGAVALLGFAGLGVGKGLVFQQSLFRSAAVTSAVGATAACLAYGIGAAVQAVVSAANP